MLSFRRRQRGFTFFEVIIALGVFAIAVVGLITALNTAMQAALEVRQRAQIRQELESRIALRQAIPLDKEKLVIEAKENHGIRLEETLVPQSLQNKDGEELPRRTRGSSLILSLKSFGPWRLGRFFPSFDRGLPFQQTVLRARVEATASYDAVPARAHPWFGDCGIL